MQLRAYAAHFRMSEEAIEAQIWTPQHQWAGDEIYGMCIDLRGFYLKVSAPCRFIESTDGVL